MTQDSSETLGLPADQVVRHDFDRAINALDDQFVQAALSVVDAMPGFTQAFLQADLEAIARARAFAEDVSARILLVEDAGFVMLAREAPVGSDLRRLVAILRLASSVERSGHLLRHVAESAEHLDARELPESLRAKLAEMAERATEVLRAGIDAWRSRDGLAITDVDLLDEVVDQLQLSLLEEAGATNRVGNDLMVIGLIARYLERIADHGVALAKDAAFVVTGQRVTI